ncbi:MAG TPA: hypothetical protein VN892_06060 [Solirubrobacteraceae bacterium]|nr:hypothetical protein [Solirubrobacteraceae bacterium]
MQRPADIALLVTAIGLLSAVAGYLFEVPAMTFFGILFAAIAFGVHLGSLLIDRSERLRK